MMINGTVVKHRSRTQASRAPRAAEASYQAVFRGSARGPGMQSMMTDWGLSTQVRVWADHSTAKAIASRRVLGRTRHIELMFLWLPEMTKSGRMRMKCASAEQHLADHLTKGKTWCESDELIRGVGGRVTVSFSRKENEQNWKKCQKK